MDNTELIRKITEDALAMLDYEENPELVSYFGELSNKEDYELEEPMDIAGQIRSMQPLPQSIWDCLIEIYDYEIANGNADAMNDLGAMYYDGSGCEQSFEKAVHYYKMAAANGSRQAQENLGYCYYYGRNMPVDYEKAFHYFALGAFDGHLISLYKIADMYSNGYYVEKNEKEAFAIYEQCVNMLTDESAPIVAGPVYLRLGNAYLYGKGTDPNYEIALICFQKAEVFLFNMVKAGDVMYKKSLQAAIDGQAKARKLMQEELPKRNWIYD